MPLPPTHGFFLLFSDRLGSGHGPQPRWHAEPGFPACHSPRPTAWEVTLTRGGLGCLPGACHRPACSSLGDSLGHFAEGERSQSNSQSRQLPAAVFHPLGGGSRLKLRGLFFKSLPSFSWWKALFRDTPLLPSSLLCPPQSPPSSSGQAAPHCTAQTYRPSAAGASSSRHACQLNKACLFSRQPPPHFLARGLSVTSPFSGKRGQGARGRISFLLLPATPQSLKAPLTQPFLPLQVSTTRLWENVSSHQEASLHPPSPPPRL